MYGFSVLACLCRHPGPNAAGKFQCVLLPSRPFSSTLRKSVDLRDCPRFRADIPCTVSSIKFMADPERDEVFAKIRLVPVDVNTIDFDNDRPIEANRYQDKPPISITTLAQSYDVEGFSITKYCVDMIFPKLVCSRRGRPAHQTIQAKDVHGEVWKFRHFSRGIPRRHLLTTGWDDFVKHKNLTAEDSVVFMRAENGDLCVGIRRAKRSRGPVKVEDVIGAASLADSGKPFEVVYWPRAGTPEFCVRASIVGAAMRIPWSTGMRFRMVCETEDWMRIGSFMGTIISDEDFDPVSWPEWDDPEPLQNMNCISPWVVQVVPDKPTTIDPPPSSPAQPRPKKTRLSPPQHPDVDGEVTLPAFSDNPLLGSYNNPIDCLSDNAPAGMEGARHDVHPGLSLSDLPNLRNIPLNLFPVDSLGFDGSSQPTAPSNPIISKPGSNENMSRISALKSKKSENDEKAMELALFGQPINTVEQISSTSRSSDTVLNISSDSSADRVGNTSDASGLDLNRNDGPEHSSWQGFQTECKVFMQSEDAGRTMDLSLVGSYEELYEKLASLFGISISDVLNRVVYRDNAGVIRQLGDEPFR
ncbi:hypothetical protein DH2020_040061 [Rehmannia glutinosa]|uniref:Auxin response factor n=1 Tax=Rehmannia glutinosa TaxID=99300 RepID=A0ABR0UW66_REHGL